MSKNDPDATYQSYLVRLWHERPHGTWRASSQSVQTREVVYFADLEALVEFLWGEVKGCQRMASGKTEEADHE